MRIARSAALGGLAVLAACSDTPAPSAPIPDALPAAPLASSSSRGLTSDGQAIDGRYIVVYKALSFQVSNMAGRMIPAGEGSVLDTYDTAIKGFVADLTPAGLAAVRANPSVAYVEQDQIVSIDVTQTGATWGLDRIDQRNLPLTTTYIYGRNGAGVNTYIIDTGILTSHTEFGGRALSGYTAINDGRGSSDCNGHGTHVAGTVGGTRYGVAKGVRLYAVRVLGCNGSGTNSGVIAGVNWVARNRIRPAVANMSLGGGYSLALNQAVAGAVAAGVSMAVAAGNSNTNACNSSPASEPSAITVGATTSSDARASFSNFGTCLDIFAPGASITSAWSTSNTAINTISGTSMAAPHVAGAAALFLAGSTTATPAQVTSALISRATLNKVTSAGTGSPNRLLFTGFP